MLPPFAPIARTDSALDVLGTLALGNGHLRTPDLLIIGAYLLAITAFGLQFREKKGKGEADRSLKTYFLAGNTIPWWAIALSVVSAETSTLTVVSIPGVAFAGNFGFLQVVLGYLLGRVVVATLFLPRYFAGEMLTAYQLIDRRFGPTLHKVTAGLFLFTRAAAEGVRVFAVSIVVAVAIGTGDVLSIAIISALTLLYTFEGGLAAVIWTDVAQMAIYVGGTLVALLTLGHHVAGGWPTIVHTASAAHKFDMLNFGFNLTESYTFWAGVLGGTFLTMASHGTDQLMVQRLLAARSLRESQWALLSSGVVIFAQFAFFLLIGAGLWVFYGQRLGPHAAASFRTNDYIFPTFIVREMPVGVAGLLIAAILAAAMSNLSAALNSLSSTTVIDFYVRARPRADARERDLVAKSSTVLWALVLFSIAVYSIRVGGKGHVVEIGLSIAAVAYGCLLGVFLLGTLTTPQGRYAATEHGAAIGMLCGFALNLWLWQGTFPVHLGPLTIPHIAFTWYVLIGAAATFTVGILASLALPSRTRPVRKAVATAMLLPFLLSFPKGICVSSAEAQTPVHGLAFGTLSPPEGEASAAPPSRLSSRSAAEGSAVPPQSPQPTTQQPSPNPANPQISPRTPDASKAAPTTPEPRMATRPKADFSLVSSLMNDAIAAHKLPGAVLVIGHGGEIVLHGAYGNRKLAGEPGLDGQPSPAEPMTEDTVFDMASLSKVIVTSTAIGQLYEAKKLAFDAPLEQYLPDFNPTHDPQRVQVTLRLLLTHTSGEPPDIDLKDPWGLAAPDKAEGLRRALSTPLAGTPGAKMVYSDINFILLGALVEKLSGERLDEYAEKHIFLPLGTNHTSYLPFDKACGAYDPERVGAVTIPRATPKPTTVHLPDGTTGVKTAGQPQFCDPNQTWNAALIYNTAPTAHDDEGTPATNPDFNHLLRGTVHDPTTRRMGGVAGHAGVFSTAADMSVFAQALLDRLAGRPSKFPLKRLTLELMTAPEQPGHTPFQVGQHYRATLPAQVRSSRLDIHPELPSRPEAGGRSGETPVFAPAQTLSSRPELTHVSAVERPAAGRATSPRAAANPPQDPLLAPNYPAIPGENLRGYGWDIDSGYSKPRGRIFPVGSFGHTGFTGTSLWLDPGSDTFVLLLSNAIHPHPGAAISNLRGEVATAAAQALNLYPETTLSQPHTSATKSPTDRRSSSRAGLTQTLSSRPKARGRSGETPVFGPAQTLFSRTEAHQTMSARPEDARSAAAVERPAVQRPTVHLRPLSFALPSRRSFEWSSRSSPEGSAFLPKPIGNPAAQTGPSTQTQPHTKTGLDVLEATHFAALTKPGSPPLRLGLLTNATGLDAGGRRTVDILFTDLPKALPSARLTTLFSPEHGLFGAQDTEHLATETDLTTHLPVTSLYGPHDSDKRPSHEQLKDLDAVVIDLGDAGVRCFTYETVTGYFLEAAAHEKASFHHDLEILILDRPDPLGGEQVGGPVSDPGTESYINYMPIPLRHGLTLGELARYINATRGLHASLTVVPMRGWRRDEVFADTGLPFTPPSPNLRSPAAELLYPATVFLEQSNLSVGRGASGSFEPFTVFGAGPGTDGQTWFSGKDVAAALTARGIPGVQFEAVRLPVADDRNHYPFHGQTIEAVHLTLTDRQHLNTSELGLELLAVLHRLYPVDFQLARTMRLLASRATLDALARGEDPHAIAASIEPQLEAFRAQRAPFLLYPTR